MKTPILIAGWATGPSTSAVNYLPGLASPSSNTSVAWFSTLANAQTPVAAAGSFKNLVVRVPTTLTQGSYTVTLVLNGVDQALSVVINTVSGQTVADSTHSISVAAGDKIALKITPSGTPTAQAQIQFAMVFETAGSNGALFAHCQGANVSGTNVFTAPGCYSSNGQTASTQRTAVMPCAGSISVLYANLSAAPGTGLNRTVTLVKNGVDQTALTISDAATDGSVTFGTAISYAIGDTLTIRCGTTTTTAAHIKISTDWTPTNANEVPVFGLWSSVPGTSATAFSPLNGTAIGTEATETNTDNIAPVGFTMTAFRADIGTAPGSGKSRAFTVRQNAANSATTVTISGTSSTTASWTGTLSIAADDLLAVSEVPSGTPSGAGNAKVSAVIKATDSSASLSGQSVTTSIGSLLASTSMPMTGSAVVVGQGSVLQGAPLTGQTISASQGSVVSVTSVALTGQSISAASGSVTAAQSFVLSGKSLASTQGSLAASTGAGVIGQALAAAPGAVLGATSLSLSGQAVTATRGTLTPTISFALSGQSATASLGSATAAVNLALGGQVLASSAGQLLGATTLSLSGQALSSARGTVTVGASDVTVALTGQALAVAHGVFTLTTSQALIGQAVAIQIGVLSPALNRALTGGAVTAARAAIAPTFDATLAGLSLIAGQGLMQPIAITTLAGVAAFLAQTSVTPESITALAGLEAGAEAGTIRSTKVLGTPASRRADGIMQPRTADGLRIARTAAGSAASRRVSGQIDGRTVAPNLQPRRASG